MLVVDALEVVEVADENRERVSCGEGILHRGFQGEHHRPAVRQAGECVRHGKPLQLVPRLHDLGGTNLHHLLQALLLEHGALIQLFPGLFDLPRPRRDHDLEALLPAQEEADSHPPGQG